MRKIKRYLKEPKSSYFLFGPRGTGKTTWLQQTYKDSIYIDLLEPENYRKYNAHPERLIEVLEGNPDKKTIIIDEIQKIPALLDLIHKLIEKKDGRRYIMTGSSARKLKKHGVDLLAGRAALRRMQPFMASEMGNEFNFDKSMKYGLVPVIYGGSDPKEALKAYTTLYVREEIQMEGLVRNIGSFTRFLEAISFSHASVLNISNVARECEVERKTVENYMSILEDLLIAYKIPVFTKKAKRAMSKHSKVYIFDTGVFRSIRPTGPLDRTEEIDGACLEGMVAQHLNAWSLYSSSDSEVYFWRTLAGSEVDFVLYGKDVFCAIEVKNSSKIHPKDLRSLKSFSEDYPNAKLYFIYRGKEILKKNNIHCVPIEVFLKQLVPDKAV
jgi:predicted AAA+ superfamily ATPase